MKFLPFRGSALLAICAAATMLSLVGCGDRYDGSSFDELSATDPRYGGRGVVGPEGARGMTVAAPQTQTQAQRGTAQNLRVPKLPPRFIWTPTVSPEGPVAIDISLERQQISVYRGGVLIGRSPVSTGRAGKETPPGRYKILEKKARHLSNLYGSHVDVHSGAVIRSARSSDPVPNGAKYVPAKMPYMQRLTYDGIALHAGELPGYPASAGCIRLPQGFAERLYTVTSVGDEVRVF